MSIRRIWLTGVFVFLLATPFVAPRSAHGERRLDAAAAIADGERDADRVRVREQHLDRRTRRRRRAPPHELPGRSSENPHFSPDGKRIAFSAEYAGNIDVYVVPAEGGEPKRLTWHPGADLVQGWTPDGKSVLFSSTRASWAPSATARFWTVPADGGVEEPLPLPRAYQGKVSADGTHIAYRMNNSWDEERRNYRGGQNRPIWIVDPKTFDVLSPPWTDSKEMDPAWVGDTVYFLSDRDGVSNVWCYETKTKKLTQVTKFTDFDVKTLDAGAGVVVFEQAGYVHELDPKTRQRARREHHRGRRFPVDDAALGRRHEPHDEHRALADRQARRRRSARRDLHDSGREGRRAQPEPLERIGRARSRVVAGRQVRVVLQRQVGRVQAGDRSAGRPRAAARDRARPIRRITTRRRGRPTRRRSCTPTRI